ncbi:MAG: TatD family hydrolase [Parashewanella sp.]
MMLIDSHAHLDLEEFDHDRAELFTKMHQHGITKVLIPAISPQHWQKQIRIAQQYDCLFSLGIHPWFATNNKSDISELEHIVNAFVTEANFVAIGECGLDKIKKQNWQQQLVIFEAQIVLANQFKMPLIVHSVKSHNEVQLLLKKHQFKFGGVIHGFYGNIDVAKKYIELGFKLGVGGLLLNEGVNKLAQCVTELSLNNFILETDSPSMLPKGRPESRNTPLLICDLVTKMAILTEKTPVLISEQNERCFYQLFEK